MKLKIVETVLRDGHQSLMATRMKTEDMLPILGTMEEAGYYAVEAWGGATYDSCIRYLKEDPFERLRILKKHFKKTKIQMLLRGQNLLGYRHYADDVVDRFMKEAISQGIDIVRIFDALNDFRNIEQAIKSGKKYGGHIQGALSYTTSPVHTVEYYITKAKELEQLGVDSICIKDMAGVMGPQEARALVMGIKQNSKLPLDLHTHATAGLSYLTYQAAVEAGVDIIDTAATPFANGTSQPATDVFAYIYKGTAFDLNLKEEALAEINKHFSKIQKKYVDAGVFKLSMLVNDINTLTYQVPGGMISNMYSQLEQAGASSKFLDVMQEIPKVRADLGFPPLVTPLSQMVGTQAVFNVMMGKRYGNIPKEIQSYLLGKYGKPPAEINQEIFKDFYETHGTPIVHRPADELNPEWDSLKSEIGTLAKNDEDVLTYALFKEVGKDYLDFKYNGVATSSNAIASDEVIEISTAGGIL